MPRNPGSLSVALSASFHLWCNTPEAALLSISFDGVLPKSGNRCHPLVVQALGKKVTSVVVQGNRYPRFLSLERYALAFGCVAFGTAKLIMPNAEIVEKHRWARA